MMNRIISAFGILTVLASWSAAPMEKGPVAFSDEAPVWRDVHGDPLPFQSEAEILKFLEEADAVSFETLGEGVTRPEKVLLRRDGVEAHGIFRDVHIQKQKVNLGGIIRWNFKDEAAFEVAAYQVSSMLGFDMVPPAVIRKLKGKTGSLQIWVENAFTEERRRQRHLQPPDPGRWNQQQTMRLVFDALVANEDRNLGNSLIDEDWRLWLIDHTRCFHPLPYLRQQERILQCDRKIWQALKEFSRDEARQRLKKSLGSKEIKLLLERWENLVEHLDSLIAEKGEEGVLFDGR